MKNNKLNSKIIYSIAITDEFIMKAKNLCHDVYLKTGYINEPYPDRIIPNDLEHASTYIVAIDNNEVIGTLRITAGPPFTTLTVWKDNLFTDCNDLIKNAIDGRAFEIGALAVKKEYSGLKISLGLYMSAYCYCVMLGLEYGVISIDTRALRTLEMNGWKAIRIGEPKMYFGSMTVPAIMPVIIQPISTQPSLITSIYLAA